MSEPYAGTVTCDVVEDGVRCGLSAIGRYLGTRYCCRSHAEAALIAGLYDGPLPKMPEWRKDLEVEL